MCDYCAECDRLDIPTCLRSPGELFWLRPLAFFEALGDFHFRARLGEIFWR